MGCLLFLKIPLLELEGCGKWLLADEICLDHDEIRTLLYHPLEHYISLASFTFNWSLE